MPAKINHSNDSTAAEINNIASLFFDHLSSFFPICMSSDEFHFFPQIRSDSQDWSKWDNFSSDAISDVLKYLKERRQDLQSIDAAYLTIDEHIDISMLKRVIKTILEQLDDVKFHLNQPTFYLTILGIGISEAIEAGQSALTSRMKGMPAFIDHARCNLEKIPGMYRDMGCEMIQQLHPWLKSLNVDAPVLAKGICSLEKFNEHLKHVSISDEFLPAEDTYAQIAFHHMGCYMGLDEISSQLDLEISETRSILESLCAKISPKTTWPETIRTLPRPNVDSGSVKNLYHSIISKLADHCEENKFIDPGFKKRFPVIVKEVPDYLLPMRSNAAYSMPPGYPPLGGIFYIMASNNKTSVAPDFQLLTAHETFPGHHLLDTCRWRLKRLLRRHMEFPIFYEGWASFSEELLFDTGFFSSTIDKLLLAKRRHLRAVRGRIDLDIHTRKRNLTEAAGLFVDYGMDQKKAIALVRRYTLKPGYQLSYTIGRCFFRNLYERFKHEKKDHTPSMFTRQVLSQGEIGFEHLSKIILQGGTL